MTKKRTAKRSTPCGAGRLTAVLRDAIQQSGLPLLRLAQEAGIERASLQRFVRGERSLRLDKADLLAEYFGLTLSAADRRYTTGHHA